MQCLSRRFPKGSDEYPGEDLAAIDGGHTADNQCVR